MIDDKFYPVSIEACGKLGCPTIVVTRYRELLPETLPDNVVWYEYLPLDMILQQVGVLIHHGGMGTLSGAMKAAIPQLVLPYYVDRPYNANLVYQLGIGNYLSKVNWTPDKIADMILELRETYGADIYQHYRKKMIENHGVTAAADYVEKMIGNETYNYELRKPFNLEFENTITSKQTEKGKEVLSKLTESQKRQLLMRLAKVVSSKL